MDMKTTMEKQDLLGAVTANLLFISVIMVLICRLMNNPDLGRWFGYLDFLLGIPLIYLLLNSPSQNRSKLYVIQISCMLSWLVLEALLDYIFKLDFRDNMVIVIPYVMLFFAGTGGMVGVASYAGRFWMILSIILFFIMGALAFIQRWITGL
jgi:hypothetical protein